jgi:hypothetical protein
MENSNFLKVYADIIIKENMQDLLQKCLLKYAEEGDLDRLKFMYNNGCFLTKEVAIECAKKTYSKNKYYDCLLFCVEKKCKIHPRVLIHLIDNKQIHFAIFIIEYLNLFHYAQMVSEYVYQKGYLDDLLELYMFSFPIPSEFKNNKIEFEKHHLMCLIYADKKGYKFNISNIKFAADNNHVSCLIYLNTKHYNCACNNCTSYIECYGRYSLKDVQLLQAQLEVIVEGK